MTSSINGILFLLNSLLTARNHILRTNLKQAQGLSFFFYYVFQRPAGKSFSNCRCYMMLFSSDLAIPIGRQVLLGRLEERSMRTVNETSPTSSVPSMLSVSESLPPLPSLFFPSLRSLCDRWPGLHAQRIVAGSAPMWKNRSFDLEFPPGTHASINGQTKHHR